MGEATATQPQEGRQTTTRASWGLWLGVVVGGTRRRTVRSEGNVGSRSLLGCERLARGGMVLERGTQQVALLGVGGAGRPVCVCAWVLQRYPAPTHGAHHTLRKRSAAAEGLWRPHAAPLCACTATVFRCGVLLFVYTPRMLLFVCTPRTHTH